MSSASESSASDIPACVICDQVAVGVGPFSHCHLCQQHLNIDLADAHKLKESVAEELQTYSQDFAGKFSAETAELKEQLQEIEQILATMQRNLAAFCTNLSSQIQARVDAVRICQRDLQDVLSYQQEITTAENADNIVEVVQLAESMQLSLPDLKADFQRAKDLRAESDITDQQLQRLRQLQRLVGCAIARRAVVSDAATETAADDIKIDAATMCRFDGTAASSTIAVRSHEVKQDGWVHWLAVCCDTSGFVADRSGRVVPASLADEASEALSQPCIFAVQSDKDYLTVMSVDGSQKLKCHCAIAWKKLIWGLHCDRRQLFIAQPDAVTVADLSGRIRFYIKNDLENFGDIWGIGGNAASMFVSSGNKIAAFSKKNFEFQYVITLFAYPDADLYNMFCWENYILVVDKYHNMVHQVSIDNKQLMASYPKEMACNVAHFSYPYDVAVDSRGRLFVSEFRSHSVRALSLDNGSLLWTLGLPGENGSSDDKLCCPCGVAVATVGQGEQLVVADRNNKRILVFDLVFNADS